MGDSNRGFKDEQPEETRGTAANGGARISRRSLLNAGGASMAMVVMSRLGDQTIARSIELPSTGAQPAAPGFDFLVSVPSPADGRFAITQVSASDATVVSQDLTTAVVSPDRRSAVYGSSHSPTTAPPSLTVAQPEGGRFRAWTHHSPALPSTQSFCETCVLSGPSGAVVSCYDTVNVQGQSPAEHGAPGAPLYSLTGRTVVVTGPNGTVSLPLPVGPNDVMGTEIVPIDDTNVAILTSAAVVPRVLTKQPQGTGPPSGSVCHIINTATGQISSSAPVAAGPGAGENLSVGNGVVARLVGGPSVELIDASSSPIRYPAPLAARSRRYVPAGYANPATGTLTLFDFAEGALLSLELGTGQTRATSSIPLAVTAASRGRRPAADVDANRGQLLVADPSNSKSGVWVVDMASLSVVDRWVSMMPIGDIRVLYGTDRVLVRSPGSTTALLLDHNGQMNGAFELAGQLVR